MGKKKIYISPKAMMIRVECVMQSNASITGADFVENPIEDPNNTENNDEEDD